MNAAKKAAALSQVAVAGMRVTTELDALDICPAYLAKEPVSGRSDLLTKSLGLCAFERPCNVGRLFDAGILSRTRPPSPGHALKHTGHRLPPSMKNGAPACADAPPLDRAFDYCSSLIFTPEPEPRLSCKPFCVVPSAMITPFSFFMCTMPAPAPPVPLTSNALYVPAKSATFFRP